MKVFPEYDGMFTVFGKSYSNAVLQIRSSNDLCVWLNTHEEYRQLCPFEQHRLEHPLLHLLCPNEFLGLTTRFIYYNLHVYHDGEEVYDYQDENDPHDGYHGYLTDTKYLDGREDGTYWNCCVEVPFMWDHNASYTNAVKQHKYFLATGKLLF